MKKPKLPKALRKDPVASRKAISANKAAAVAAGKKKMEQHRFGMMNKITENRQGAERHKAVASNPNVGIKQRAVSKYLSDSYGKRASGMRNELDRYISARKRK